MFLESSYNFGNSQVLLQKHSNSSKVRSVCVPNVLYTSHRHQWCLGSYAENEWSLRKVPEHGQKGLPSKRKCLTLQALFHYHSLLPCCQPDFLLLGKITSCTRGSSLQLSCGGSHASTDPLVPYSCLHGCTRRFSCLYRTHMSGLQLKIPH